MIRLNTEEFIKRTTKKHNNKYNYSLVDYKKWNIKIKIICPDHGTFEQIPSSHLKGSGCKKCANEKLKKNKLFDTETFVKGAKKIHGNKYNYSLVDYKGMHVKVKIICSKHGTFETVPYAHIRGGNCNKCNKSFKLTKEIFVKRAKKIHENKYNYSLINYMNNRTKVKIICPDHGIFEQTANNHLQRKGCKKCDTDSRKLNTNKFITLSKKIHGNKYNYSLTNYMNNRTKVKIICPDHGTFEQTANNHLSQKQGCPSCKESKGERQISIFLKENKIKYTREFKFDNCKNKRALPFDFHLTEQNVCIEYDGIQHFKIIDYFGGENGFKKLKKHDKIKDEYCKNNNIRLLRIKYNENVKEKIKTFLKS